MIRYTGQLLASMRRHLGEAALALLIAVAVMSVGIGSTLPVLPLVLALVLFQFGAASWRLYRSQQVSIATARSLRNLDDYERVKSEARIRAHYEHRERRLQQWHDARVKRLIDDVAEVSRQLTQFRDGETRSASSRTDGERIA